MANIADLRRLVQAHAFPGQSRITGLTVAAATEPTSPGSAIARPILALVAQGRKRIVFAGQIHEYGPGDFLVVSRDLPVTGQFLAASPELPALGVGIDLRPEVIAALLLEADPAGAVTPGRPTPPIAVSAASAALVDAVCRLVTLLDHPQDIPVLAPLIERGILWRLLTGPGGEVVRQIGLMDGAFSQVGRVIRAITTMSPLQFQKRVRLQEARLLLIGGGHDVSQTAFAVGYDSPSQFIREYRREYGVSPGHDAARLRATPVFGTLNALP